MTDSDRMTGLQDKIDLAAMLMSVPQDARWETALQFRDWLRDQANFCSGWRDGQAREQQLDRIDEQMQVVMTVITQFV